LKIWFVAALRMVTTFAAIWGVVICLALFVLKLLGQHSEDGFYTMVIFVFVACLVVIWINLRAIKHKKQSKADDKLK
jgi:H+/Cl- antiporter ClcA